MLGRLTKNSLKATFHSVYNIYIAMAVIGVIMLVMLLVDWTKWGDTGIGVGYLIKIVASVALCLTVAVVACREAHVVAYACRGVGVVDQAPCGEQLSVAEVILLA